MHTDESELIAYALIGEIESLSFQIDDFVMNFSNFYSTIWPTPSLPLKLKRPKLLSENFLKKSKISRQNYFHYQNFKYEKICFFFYLWNLLLFHIKCFLCWEKLFSSTRNNKCAFCIFTQRFKLFLAWFCILI